MKDFIDKKLKNMHLQIHYAIFNHHKQLWQLGTRYSENNRINHAKIATHTYNKAHTKELAQWCSKL